MTDNEIIKALVSVISGENQKCSFKHCNLAVEVYDLINRQKAEIEQLTQKDNRWALSYVNAIARSITARENAIKEFAERLKSTMFNEDFLLCEPCDMANIIDDLVKEMTEDEGK